MFNIGRRTAGNPNGSQDTGNHIWRNLTMWIETEGNTKRLQTPETDGFVAFSENGTAQVSEEVGEALIEKYDAISGTED